MKTLNLILSFVLLSASISFAQTDHESVEDVLKKHEEMAEKEEEKKEESNISNENFLNDFSHNNPLGGDDDFSTSPNLAPKKIFKTEDQVLGPFERSLYLRVSNKKKDTYKYGIQFEDLLAFEGEVTHSLGSRVEIRFDMKTYKDILSKKRGEIAEIVAYTKDNKKVIETNSPKVYIGGPYDLDCEYPVLAADYHGTLQVDTEEQIQAIDDLIERFSMPIFVVSTSGFSAKSELDTIGFKNADKILVLDNVPSSNMQNEKAQRIHKNLISNGVCVVGFAGDTPAKEGDASKELQHIPYFGVNLGKTISHHEKVTEEVITRSCHLKEGITHKIKLKSSKNKCPKKMKKKKINEVQCQALRVELQQDFWGNVSRKNTLLQEKKTFKKNCSNKTWDHSSNWSGSYKAHTQWYEISREQGVFCLRDLSYKLHGDHKQCRKEYNFKESKELKTKNKPVYIPITLDLTKYPKGSAFAQDWIELTDKISPLIENKIKK